MKADGITIDHYSGYKIDRPDPRSTLKYDFDFRKKGDEFWRYLGSSNTIEDFDHHIKCAEHPDVEWRILSSETMEIVKTNVT
jgi:hypothetical protein